MRRLAPLGGLSLLAALVPQPSLEAQTAWTTRSFDAARSSANTSETRLTPATVGRNLLRKLKPLQVTGNPGIDDDPRIEAQPLYVPGLTMSDGKVHDVVYVCTMANNVWAFDANDGTVIWAKPTSMGTPITPRLTNDDPTVPERTEIDLWGINGRWGILGTPVIDLDSKTLFVVAWVSKDNSGKVASGTYELHAIDLIDGKDKNKVAIDGDATSQGKPSVVFRGSAHKHRTALLLASIPDPAGGAPKKTIFVGFAMLHEEHDDSHGWLIAFDAASMRRMASWCTTPNGEGSGIWQAAQGPAIDENGSIYIMTGNYGIQDASNNTVAPHAGDLPESLIQLRYTPPPAAAAPGKLEATAWFTPFRDVDRHKNQFDNFQDYDFGSGGPVPLAGMKLVVGAGKDGVLYVLDTDANKLGKGSDFSKLKQPPIFFTYFPGFGIDASVIANLDKFYDDKTHHLHGSPAFWKSPTRGPMLFNWGENECLRAWTIDATGRTTFVAKSAEVASGGANNHGGMPGGFPVVSANGGVANTGIVWTTAPISGDANRHRVEGILRAYDATDLAQQPNADGSPRLKILWDSKQIPNNTFLHSKFCPPVVADGKVFVATYDGRVDVYALARIPNAKNRPVNDNRVPESPK